MRVVGASRIATAASECCRLSFDCEDNSACSTPLTTMAAVEIENGSKSMKKDP